MSISDDVKHFYEEEGISAGSFRCKHLECCKLACANFTEAREAYIGREYEIGTVPRLLFLSLDPGNGDVDPEARTLAACRVWEERQCDVNSLPKNRHWYRTHELALTLLQQFAPKLSLPRIHSYFAHTNSAKCCMNNPGNSSAAPHMFENCREYIPGELIALRPDILVTQGDPAKDAVESSFSSSVSGDLKGCGHAILDLNGRKVLWIHTYHPRNFGRFNRQRRECYRGWADDARRFWYDSNTPGCSASTDG
jgi:uracil-DNA glycosylase